MALTTTINVIESFDEFEKEPYATSYILSGMREDEMKIPEELVVSRVVVKALPHRKQTNVTLNLTGPIAAISKVAAEGVEEFDKVGDFDVFMSRNHVIKLYTSSVFEERLEVRLRADALGITPPILATGRLEGTDFYYTVCDYAGREVTKKEFKTHPAMSKLLRTITENFDADDIKPDNFTVDGVDRFWCIDPDSWYFL